MDDLLMRVERFAERHHLWQRGDTIVAGVSGGPDSLCLLHLLVRLAPARSLKLHVAHLDHGLRGVEAAQDAQVVATLAAAWGLPCTVEHADVARMAEQPGLSVEEAARQARYAFLARVALRTGARVIAVGHNLDDQAETVLMHFLRGSGLAGLRGMLPRTCLSDYRLAAGEAAGSLPGVEAAQTLWLVRPLLETPRAGIEAYCAAHGLQPRFDRSNEDTTFFRNRLRHHLLPVLEAYNPAIRSVLGHTAAVLAADYELVEARVAEAWRHVETPAPGAGAQAPAEVRFDLERWRALPLGLQRALVRRAIHVLRRNLRNINWEHVERAVWLAQEGSTGQQATLAAGLALQIGYTTLRIAGEGASWTEDAPQVSAVLPLALPGVTSLEGGWAIHARSLPRAAAPPDLAAGNDPWTAYLDAAAVGARLVVRPRREGERFQPQGMGGRSARISEYLINVKVPRDLRAGWPVVAGDAGVAWLCGLRLDERAAVRPETEQLWELRCGRREAA